ncbi:unnamed protein product [Cyclocybe aegerita]|uniref:WD40 repeat-like protein n=1 Tax=Cyclocybe aegerita TaxID=1973307 RepID=A0A8S0X152_CYCAE|nr:unnamed protein product [Cyclocybe aegerita]
MEERHRLLLTSPSLQEETAPLRSSGSSSEAYILSITSLPSHYAASASAPSNVIDIFDKRTLQGLQTLPGHEIATTSLLTVDKLGGIVNQCLVSAGKDGSVKAWDVRSNSHSIKMTNLGQSRPLLCCDISKDGLTVAAGTDLQGDDAFILYWDPRQPATPLRTHSSTHSDDITTVSFAPTRDRENDKYLLLSGSTDGLLCTSNPDEDDEDEAPLQVGNWGCSIAQAGWIHGSSKSKLAGIWAGSDMETFSTWTNELEPLMNLDIRSPVLHQGRTWVTDYLVKAHSTPTSTPNLSVFAGSNEGDVALLSNVNPSVQDAPWCLHKLWTHGHVGVVRSLLWDEERQGLKEEQHQTLITGGEDGKLNAWPIDPVMPEDNGQDEEAQGDTSMDVDMASPKQKRRELDRDGERV